MSQIVAEKLKGMIEYPCGCGPKVLVYEGTTGKVSGQCPICKKYALFDYEQMISEPCGATRGAVHNLKMKKIVSPSR